MAYPKLEHSKNQVNWAGEELAKLDEDSNLSEYLDALEVLGNWRACHGYPINTFKVTLRQKVEKVSKNAIVSQRLKRTPSIVGKLRRFPSMKLARMQDIGGLRAVLANLNEVRDLEEEYRSSRFEHELVSSKDYITNPKTDGYRGIHLVFRYKNRKNPAYDGLHLELQFRTKLQHAWATAVETMGTYLQQSLKSRQGEESWLKFFELTASAFAYVENSKLIPGYEHLTKAETFKKLLEEENKLQVLDKLRGFSAATKSIIHHKSGAFYLLILDLNKLETTIKSYPQKSLEQATKDYVEAEKRANSGEEIEVVLVSAGSVDNLRKAYPNYFLDTHSFIQSVENILNSLKTSK